jgi:hypothetical protein
MIINKRKKTKNDEKSRILYSETIPYMNDKEKIRESVATKLPI